MRFCQFFITHEPIETGALLNFPLTPTLLQVFSQARSPLGITLSRPPKGHARVLLAVLLITDYCFPDTFLPPHQSLLTPITSLLLTMIVQYY